MSDTPDVIHTRLGPRPVATRDDLLRELSEVKRQLNTMLASAEVFTDSQGVVIGYKIKTGALHRLVGLLDLTVPVNLPEAIDAARSEAKP